MSSYIAYVVFPRNSRDEVQLIIHEREHPLSATRQLKIDQQGNNLYSVLKNLDHMVNALAERREELG